MVVTQGVPSLHQVPALRLSYYRWCEWQGGSRARPWVAPTSAGGSPPCPPDPKTILETRQDELPHQREKKTGLGPLSSKVLAGVTPGSDLEGLLVVCGLKYLLTRGIGPGKPVTAGADADPCV